MDLGRKDGPGAVAGLRELHLLTCHRHARSLGGPKATFVSVRGVQLGHRLPSLLEPARRCQPRSPAGRNPPASRPPPQWGAAGAGVMCNSGEVSRSRWPAEVSEANASTLGEASDGDLALQDGARLGAGATLDAVTPPLGGERSVDGGRGHPRNLAGSQCPP